MPHRMRKIVSKCRPKFIGPHHRTPYKHSTNGRYSYDNIHINSNVIESPDPPSCPTDLNSNRRSIDHLRPTLNHSSTFSSYHSLTSSTMQSSTNSTNIAAMATGIVPPPMHSPQSSYMMQSTTPSVANGKDEMRGWLYKWTNYLKGYQKRWFVLQAGILSYYRSQDEMSHTCRGTVYLESAQLSSEESCHFIISNGSTVIHLRTSSENDKQRWMTALELAKQKAMKAKRQYLESDEEISTTDETTSKPTRSLQQTTANASNEASKATNNSSERAEFAAMNRIFDSKLEDLKTCMDLINRHYQALHRTLGDLEQIDKSDTTASVLKSITERATLFRITSTAMVNSCQELVQLIQNQGRKWQKTIQFERDARQRMERMCEQVASQSAKLEKQIQRASRKSKGTSSLPTHSAGATGKSTDTRHSSDESHSSDPDDDEDDEFHDAVTDPSTVSVFRIPLQPHLSNADKQTPNILADDVSSGDDDDESESEENQRENLPLVIVKKSKKDDANAAAASTTVQNAAAKQIVPRRQRRTRIPERPNQSVNLWNIMKNCVGKDLSKIPIPVNFSEPLSMLQRVTEELEYSSVLDRAAQATDSWEQMAYVAAFTVSSYSTTSTRVNKPFNPLLGETFECDRTDDLGWKVLSEQVSHHPPAFATHAEGQGWVLYQEFTMGSKFRGQYLSVTPLGYSHLIMKNTGNHFTWKKVTTLVNNIIVGKLWIDNVGEMDIINHTTKDVCKLKYFPYSYFSKEVPHKVTGVVVDAQSEARWVLTGTWTEKIEGGPVETNGNRRTHAHHMETSNMRLLWERKMPPAYMEKMYNFTELAIQLNEPEADVAPTDSRRRPDQRLMEEARWDEANEEKLRLEEKQRQARKQRETRGNGVDSHKPKWFKKQYDPLTDSESHIYTNEYWECKGKQDWSRCDDIF